MHSGTGPLLTSGLALELERARRSGADTLRASFDLGRSVVTVRLGGEDWAFGTARYPYPGMLKERSVYAWLDGAFTAVSRYGRSLVKLVPTDWGPPTFEIDGIKMLPTARLSPLEDARAKVALVRPRGRRLLDTCGGLGYFAAEALAAGVDSVLSFEADADVIWLRSLNPWSPPEGEALELRLGDAGAAIATLPDAAFEAALHDPPRFGIAGDLYSAHFYGELRRVLRRGARLFHYTGTPNRLTSGRDVPGEVLKRLTAAGFSAERALDGVLAIRR